MKCTILIKENRTQLVLHPESKHDNNVLNILQEMPNTHRRNLYDRQGGFTMFDDPHTGYGGDATGNDLMLVFDKEVQDVPTE